MCPFWKRKKKKYTALKVVAIVFTALAALAGAYVIFEKFFKDKLLKKLGKGCCEDECAGLADEVEDADDTAECQVVEPCRRGSPGRRGVTGRVRQPSRTGFRFRWCNAVQ